MFFQPGPASSAVLPSVPILATGFQLLAAARLKTSYWPPTSKSNLLRAELKQANLPEVDLCRLGPSLGCQDVSF